MSTGAGHLTHCAHTTSIPATAAYQPPQLMRPVRPGPPTGTATLQQAGGEACLCSELSQVTGLEGVGQVVAKDVNDEGEQAEALDCEGDEEARHGVAGLQEAPLRVTRWQCTQG